MKATNMLWVGRVMTALFALCGFAISRRPRDPAAGSNLVFASALLGSTVVTVVGLPPSWAFAGILRWLFVANVGFFYTLAWAGMLARARSAPVSMAAVDIRITASPWSSQRHRRASARRRRPRCAGRA